MPSTFPSNEICDNVLAGATTWKAQSFKPEFAHNAAITICEAWISGCKQLSCCSYVFGSNSDTEITVGKH